MTRATRPPLAGERTVLVPVDATHVPELRRILATPAVRARWGDEARSPRWPFDDPDAVRLAVLLEGAVAGMVQFSEEEDPAYRHAAIDASTPRCTAGGWGATPTGGGGTTGC